MIKGCNDMQAKTDIGISKKEASIYEEVQLDQHIQKQKIAVHGSITQHFVSC